MLIVDGIIEAHDVEGNIPGDSGRLERVLTGFTRDMTTEAMVDTVISDTMDYASSTREDDCTMVIAKVIHA